MKVLKVLVLLVSIAGASALVWNATRDRKPEEARKEGVISPKSMQGSSKSKAIVDSGVILSFAEESGVPEVTDEEVKAMRDSMLNTSKSGIIMSDDKIREMLEKRAKLKDEKEVDSNPELLLSGSKSRVAISYDDLRKIAEEHAKQ